MGAIHADPGARRARALGLHLDQIADILAVGGHTAQCVTVERLLTTRVADLGATEPGHRGSESATEARLVPLAIA